jgi:hypothetical protein
MPEGRRLGEMLHVRVDALLYDRVCRIALRINLPATVVARMMIERDTARLEALAHLISA